MARPRKIPTRSIAEIESAFAEEMGQLSLLQRDLRDALVLRENTRSYRAALAETEREVASLRAALENARALEAARRQEEVAADAAALIEEANTAHAAFLATLEIPSLHFKEATDACFA